MKKIILIFLLLINFAFCADYSVYKPKNYSLHDQEFAKILFILDFSNSMNEYLDNKRKVDIMLDTITELLPQINNNVSIGFRIYGHHNGFTPIDSCRATNLILPLNKYDDSIIENKLRKYKPNGMTPITYSLKQAIKYDFLGFKGIKHIVLITDGGENCDESPCKYVMELIKIRSDVKIDVIAINLDDEDDITQLKCTAHVTNGKFYNTNTAVELAKNITESINNKKSVSAKIMMN